MDYDDDDLPAGYPNPWAMFLQQVRRQRVDPTRQREPEAMARYSRTHYAKAKDDPEWVANRRAYYRARYAAGKDRKR